MGRSPVAARCGPLITSCCPSSFGGHGSRTTPPYDDACAASFQSVVELTHNACRESKGRVIDFMIAATAIVHQADLVTPNPKDFAGLESLMTVVEVCRDPSILTARRDRLCRVVPPAVG